MCVWKGDTPWACQRVGAFDDKASFGADPMHLLSAPERAAGRCHRQPRGTGRGQRGGVRKISPPGALCCPPALPWAGGTQLGPAGPLHARCPSRQLTSHPHLLPDKPSRWSALLSQGSIISTPSLKGDKRSQFQRLWSPQDSPVPAGLGLRCSCLLLSQHSGTSRPNPATAKTGERVSITLGELLGPPARSRVGIARDYIPLHEP